jgi:hypothetical protein
MRNIHVKAEDKEGVLIAEFELGVPETFDEMAEVPGKETALAYVVDKMKIVARAKYKGKGSTSVLPKKDQKIIKEALEGGELSLGDLMEFIKSRKVA